MWPDQPERQLMLAASSPGELPRASFCPRNAPQDDHLTPGTASCHDRWIVLDSSVLLTCFRAAMRAGPDPCVQRGNETRGLTLRFPATQSECGRSVRMLRRETNRRILARLPSSRLGATRTQISPLRRAGHLPKLAREQPVTANWNLHVYAGPSYLSRARHAVRARLGNHATPLTWAPCRSARQTGNSAAGDLATQRSGNDEAEHRLSPVGAGGRGLGP